MKPISVVEGYEHNANNMFVYGRDVIEKRALVDFRDGLLPVQRKILYAAYHMGLRANGASKKSARLVGEVIGKYSPHGDLATYDAAVKMVNSPTPTMNGEGTNFGSMTDDAAAYRYTNIRLSKYGQENFFDPELIATAKFIPNFDGTEQEPLVLPSLLPNLLLNGSFGIAPGITSDIPSFKIKGVAKLTKQALSGKPVTSKDCLSTLECNFSRYDSTEGKLYKDDKESQEQLKSFYEKGEGSVYVTPDYSFDAKTRTISITSIPPRVDMEKLLEKCREDENVAEANDETSKSDPFLIQVVLKKTIPAKKYKSVVNDIIDNYFTGLSHWKFNVTEQFYNEEKEAAYADLISMGLIEFFKRWTKWRIEIELEALKYRENKQKEAIELQNLLILAASSIDIIMAALKRQDTEVYLQKKLKITAEQVETILSRQIKTLKALNLIDMQKKLKTMKVDLQTTKGFIKNPAEKIVGDIDMLLEKLK